MKFDYPNMTAESCDGMRVYMSPAGNYYPSITTILGGTESEEKKAGLRNWQKSLGETKAAQITREAADHGTAVHLLAERFLKGEELTTAGDGITPANIAAFNALKLKLKKVTHVYGQEVALYSDMMEVAGRADLVADYNGVMSIVDFKTSMRLKGEHRIEDYKLQLCAYAIMHNEMFGTDIQRGVILMTSDGGFPQEFIVDLNEYAEKLLIRVKQFNKRFA